MWHEECSTRQMQHPAPLPAAHDNPYMLPALLQARTCVPFRLRLWHRGDDFVEQAQILTTPGVPWTGCTSLCVALEYTGSGAVSGALLPSMLAVAAEWPRLRQLELDIPLPEEEKMPEPQEQEEQEQQQQQAQGVQQEAQQGPPQQQLQEDGDAWDQGQQEAVPEPDIIAYTAEPSR